VHVGGFSHTILSAGLNGLKSDIDEALAKAK
jgi:hypothetical protein